MTFNPGSQILNWTIEHAAVGATAVFVIWFVIPQFFWLALIGFIILVLLKEAFYDSAAEADNPFWPEGVLDFLEYIIGYVPAIYLIALTGHMIPGL